jgi:hypothetical protein
MPPRLTVTCGCSRPSATHRTSHPIPHSATVRGTACGPMSAAMLGMKIMARVDPRYMPDVVMETARARSCAGIHSATTECTAGMMRPCDTPTRTRTRAMRRYSSAEEGWGREGVGWEGRWVPVWE